MENTIRNGQFILKNYNMELIINILLSDESLSLGAVGLYMVMAEQITKPDYIMHKSNIRKGRSIKKYWGQLETSGYLKSCRIHHKNGGVIKNYILLDKPDFTTLPLINVQKGEEIPDGVVKKIAMEENFITLSE